MTKPLATAAGAVDTAAGAVSTYVAALSMPLVSGLISEGLSTPSTVVGAITSNPKWSELQATLNGPLLHPNPIDKALALGKPVRVRPWLGRYSPQFAFDLAGTVVVVDANDPAHPVSAKVPRWWDTKLQAAQGDLYSKLAAAYDGRIPLVFLAPNMTMYAEPFQRGTGDPTTRKNLLAAGYTQALDKASYHVAIQMATAFKRTRIGQAYNPWQSVNPEGTQSNDVSFTIQMMDELRAAFGSRAVWQNNSIRTPNVGGQYTTLYAHMLDAHPVSYQTATEARVGDYAQTLDWAIRQGAHAVELSPGYDKHLSTQQLQTFDAALKANAA